MTEGSKNSSTTVIFVPGGWHEPEIFDKISSKLRADGYQTDYVYLPSISGPDVDSIEDLTPDVQEIRKHILGAVDGSQKVIVFNHSYGAVPSSEAVQGLGWKERQAAGLPGGVTHYFSCNGLIIAAGTSCIDFSGGNPPPVWQMSEDGKTCFIKDPEQSAYGELPEKERKYWAGRLKWMSYEVATAKLKYAAWESVPSTYVYALSDPFFNHELQRMMIQMIGEQYFRSETMDATHCGMLLLKADEIAKAVDRAAQLEV